MERVSRDASPGAYCAVTTIARMWRRSTALGSSRLHLDPAPNDRTQISGKLSRIVFVHSAGVSQRTVQSCPGTRGMGSISLMLPRQSACMIPRISPVP